MKTAIYPGSFDPITSGHLNIINRGLKIFDHLIVAVANNVSKNPVFSPAERMELIREAVAHNPQVEVDAFSGLLVDYANTRGVSVVLRGLRAVSDFEFEFQMNHINRRLNSKLDIVFMMTDEEFFFVSSGVVREIASFGGVVKGLVPKNVEQRLAERFAAKT